MWQMPCPTQEQSVLGVFLHHGLGVVLYPRWGTTGPSSPNVPSQGNTLGDTDFVAWVLRVAPECRNLHLHAPTASSNARLGRFSNTLVMRTQGKYLTILDWQSVGILFLTLNDDK